MVKQSFLGKMAYWEEMKTYPNPKSDLNLVLLTPSQSNGPTNARVQIRILSQIKSVVAKAMSLFEIHG